MTKESSMATVQSIHYHEKKIMELREKRFYAADTDDIDLHIGMHEQAMEELKGNTQKYGGDNHAR